MSKQYYVRRGNKISGPAKAELLKRSAANGKLKATDQVSTSHNGPWRAVSQVPSLASHLQGTPELEAAVDVTPHDDGETLADASADRVESPASQSRSIPQKTGPETNLPSGETEADLGATVVAPHDLPDNTASAPIDEPLDQTVDVPTTPVLAKLVDTAEPLGQTVDVPTTPVLAKLVDTAEPLGQTVDVPTTPTGETAADLGATIDTPRSLPGNTASGPIDEPLGQTVDVPTTPTGETAADLGATVDVPSGLSDNTQVQAAAAEESLDQTVVVTTEQAPPPPGDPETGQAPTPIAEITGDPATRHTVTRFLAEGGLGKVYVAQDDKLQREVVMKTLKDAGGEGSEARYRFVQEA
ncbi:MAG: GYF domain-containing protein, partial [Planctomycetota bacterium]|nr:GYF domain-containing protein [Planctomycetota bacterium]